jgi:hypothetical protein
VEFFYDNEIEYRNRTMREQARRARLASVATQAKPATAETARPIRQKVGILLVRMGMRLAGYTL